MRTIQDILRADAARLNATLELGQATARIEVQSLLQHALRAPRSYLAAHPEQTLNADQQSVYDAMLQRRLQGEPIAHILGEREFFGLNFKVTPDTLIPRPETELLVELALQRLSQLSNTSQPPLVRGGVGASPSPDKGRAGEGLESGANARRALDLGTGSGAIAISIAHGRSDVEVVAVDVSEAALQVALDNARRLGITNISFVHSTWFSALGGQRYDVIVSNPPYVAAGDIHLAQGDARFEPKSALVSGADGLDDIRCIISAAPQHLTLNGWLLLEHGYDQAQLVRDMLELNGFSEVFSEKDIAGIERVSGGMIGR